MADQDQDKTEQPTQYRLEEARKRGEMAKSMDATSTAVMIVFAVVTVVTVGWTMRSLAIATQHTLLLAGGKPMPGPALLAWMQQTWFPFAQALTPLVIALIAIAIVANVAQVGGVFSTHPITPDFNRLNPAQTVKRLFSMRTIWELGKMLLKLTLLAALAWMVALGVPGWVGGVATTDPLRFADLSLSTFARTSMYVLGILGVLAVLDLLMTRREHMRKMKMSRRELRDEHKRRDGDPEIKSKQKRLLRELLKKARSVSRAAEADVVLLNPTHIAVALQYRPATMRAPIVLTKGAGGMGQRIREIAASKGVPMLRSPALARALFRDVDIDGAVPEKLYVRLAPVYRWLFAQRRPALATARSVA